MNDRPPIPPEGGLYNRPPIPPEGGLYDRPPIPPEGGLILYLIDNVLCYLLYQFLIYLRINLRIIIRIIIRRFQLLSEKLTNNYCFNPPLWGQGGRMQLWGQGGRMQLGGQGGKIFVSLVVTKTKHEYKF
jgi:hypothetical protein